MAAARRQRAFLDSEDEESDKEEIVYIPPKPQPIAKALSNSSTSSSGSLKRRQIQSDDSSSDSDDDKPVVKKPVVSNVSKKPTKGKAPRHRTFSWTIWGNSEWYTVEEDDDGEKVCVPTQEFLTVHCKVVPPIAIRFMKGGRGWKTAGQWEFAPTTGKLHWQGYFTLCSVASGGVDAKTSLKNVRALALKCIRNDEASYGTQSDGLTLCDYVENYYIEEMISTPTLLDIYCTREFNEDGSRKRLPGVMSFNKWNLVDKPVDSDLLDEKPGLHQIGGMIMRGHTPLDVIHVNPAAIQYYRVMTDVKSAIQVDAAKKASDLPRCGNRFCNINHVSDAVTDHLANKLGKTRNEVMELMLKPCAMKLVYAFGASRTGKSTHMKAFADDATPGSVYVKPAHTDFWGAGTSAYSNELSVVVHDCAADCFKNLSDFKRIVDCKSYKVNIKGGEAILLARNFFIDSQHCPLTLLNDLAKGVVVPKDDYEAFCKRFTNIYNYTRPLDTDSFAVVEALTFPVYAHYVEVVRSKKLGTRDFIYPLCTTTIAMDSHRSMVNRSAQSQLDRLLESGYFDQIE
jgi:hypothetical protein